MRRRVNKQKSFKWRRGARFRIEAQPAGERLEAMRDRLGRALGREDVYEDAKSPDSPFHKEVFLDSPEAAEKKWRLEICGRILRSIEFEVITVEDNDDPETIEVVTCPVTTYVPGLGYEMTPTVLSDQELTALALADILRQLRAFRSKLARYQEQLLPLFDQMIEKAEASVEAGREAGREA